MTSVGNNQLISIQPNELKFLVELEYESYCDLKVANKTEHHVAFKVKTTAPRKYGVRPKRGVIQPWDSCIIRVTQQKQLEYPPDMQCEDKFLLQSTIVPPHTDVDELPQDTFTKGGGKILTESKLKVSYISPSTTQRSSESGETNGDRQDSETISLQTTSASPQSAMSEMPPMLIHPAMSPLDISLPSANREGTKEDGLCVICVDASSEAVCVPCGHVAGCVSCLKEIKNMKMGCPVCRANIDQVIKL
ncbi:PREDICTED: vesicle-associated protein 2-1-like [Camelina sativa]|uniref:Vesicle-associated protein 2-1-like n=1 Tax=Camelina sativa TaxID=90675 RepID=A0ABM0V6B5_CAMSA|nr:PREDICTED: vesicle-associated protein 2-1-like [Camelina sativa]